MKKRYVFLIIAAALLVLIAIAVIIIVSPRKPENVALDSSLVIPHLKDGYIILRQGEATYSAVFSDVSLTDKRFSHLGIIRIRDEEIVIINSVGNLFKKSEGVKTSTLESFLKEAMSVGIFKFKYADASQISDKSLDYLDRPFDWGFDASNDKRIYCSELMHVILKDIAPEHVLTAVYLESIGKDVIPLDSISASDMFEELFFLEIDNKNKKARK